MSNQDLKLQPRQSRFVLEGIVLQINCESGRPKVLWLATAQGEYEIKVSRCACYGLAQWPQPGDGLQVTGECKYKPEKDKLKFKADGLYPIPAASLPTIQPTTPSSGCPAAKAKILVCQGSDCRARGARAVQQRLEQTLDDRGLTNQVTVKSTGCMHCCKKGPVVVFMPDKNRYQQVTPSQIPTLVSENIMSEEIKPEICATY